jgi:hypothetical protein
MRVRRYLVLVVALLMPGRAVAEPGQNGARSEVQDESRSELTTPHGVSVAVGFGATGFVDRSARQLVGRQPSFYTDLRIVYGTRTRFAAEVAFTRSGRALPLTERRAGGQAIYGHSFEALLRVNHPGHRGSLFYSPFLAVGLGWTDFRPADDRDPASRTDLLGTVAILPVGAGCALAYRVLYVEARFMYRSTLGGEGKLNLDRKPSMQAWYSGLSVGVEF